MPMRKRRRALWWMTAAIAVLWWATRSSGAQPPLTKDRLMTMQQEAVALYRAGRYDQAVQRYHELIRLQPEQVELFKDLMWVLWKAQRLQEAAEVAAHITTRWPQEVEAWNLLGQAYILLDRPREALVAFDRSLRLDSSQFKVWRTVAQLHLNIGQHDHVISLVARLLQRYPDHVELYPLLANAQTFREQFAEAAKSWAKAREAFPENVTYAYQEVSALYRSGQAEQALARLQALVAQHPDYQPAVDVLVDHAIVRRDWATAASLLEGRLANAQPADDPQCLKLARMYAQMARPDLYLTTLDRCLQRNPLQGEALIMKAEHLKNTGQLGQAVKLYQRFLSLNPWSSRALIGLADLSHSRGRYAESIRLMERARRADPHDPYLLLTHARYLYAQGQINESNRLLTEWMARNRGPVLAALVYHGLTTSSDDPMLASPVHMTVEAFEDHMRALHEAGFTPVTTEEVRAWYEGTRELPERPVLITFDDARLDSFRHADPILARYGLKATMFVPLVNVGRNLPAYASWEQIAQYRDTGRWEIQSHGASAARYIPIDRDGRQGLFLVNRQWLPAEGRMETLEEWRQRIATDYRSSQETIAKQVGTAPVAFAYPESNYGEEGMPNVADAAPVNLALARATFGTAYHQDVHGLNVRSEDPMLLARFEPHGAMTGDDLVRHIQYRDPFTMARVTLLHHAVWQGRLREARQWLDDLAHSGAPAALRFVEQARLHFAAGDPIHGRRFIDQAMRADRGSEALQIAESLRRSDTQWVWAPSVWLQEDNRGREHVVAEQQAGSWQLGPTLWHLNHRSGMFRESGVEDVQAHGAGVGMVTNLGVFHQLSVEALGYVFSGEASETATASATLVSRVTDTFSTAMTAGQALVETARALNADVRDRYAELGAEWKGRGPWQASWLGRASDLSDDNQRFSSVIEVSRRLLEVLPSTRLLYRFTLDDAQENSLNYYSPQQLMLHQIGVHYQTMLWKGLELSARYLPGIGDEQGSDPRFVQTVQIETPWKWKDTIALKPLFFLSRTPTFRSNRVGLMMEFRF